jgi:ribosome silencing factor RsfS/YbeB/iojap
MPKTRLRHVFSTTDEALRLAELCGIDKEQTESLRIAAALHDITKYYTVSEHTEYLEGRGVTVDSDTLKSEKTLHQMSGAERARELFPDKVDRDVYDAIRYHTTGRAGMTLIEKLMYLADYIEPCRTFPDCVKLRECFYSRINNGEDRDTVLTDTLILSLEMTINDLKENGLPIHSDTVSALEYLKGEKKMEENKILSPLEIAEEIVKTLDMKKGSSIKLLHVTEKTVLADYFVICGGNSTTQVKGLSDEVEYKLSLQGVTPAHVEGHDSASWVLMDYHSVIVHIFTPDAREFYNLEKHWAEAEQVDISHLLTED